MWSKLQFWRSKNLSKGGKEVLLKAAAQSIPAFCMSTFELPSSLLDDLHKMMNAFWWGHGNDPKNGVKWESWEKLCRPKVEGGMGFRNLHLFNAAMLGKQGWRLIQYSDSLIGRILKAKYYPRSDYLHANIGNNPSYSWRGTHSTQGLVRKGTRWKIGDGTKVLFWGDPWLDDYASFTIQTLPVASFEDMVVNDFFIPETRDWDVVLLRQIFSEDECERILRTTPGPVGSIDKLVWHYERSGKYSVKSAYKLAFNLVHDQGSNDEREWNLLWKFKVPPRIKVFFWRLCRGFMAVKDKLNRWYPGMGSSACPICKEPGMTETIWHLFIDCSFARTCWIKAGLWGAMDEMCLQVDGAPEFFRRAVNKFSTGEGEKLMAMSWALWRCRNLIVWLKIK